MQKIEFEINKNLLKSLITSHKKFIEFQNDCNLFSLFHFELFDNYIKVLTTDGCRCLYSNVKVNNILKRNASFNIKATILENLVILKNAHINVNIIVDNEEITFIEYAVEHGAH